MTEEHMVKTVSDFLITECAIDVKCPPSELFAFLRARRTTGTVTFNLREGGIRHITLDERTKPLSALESGNVREILGMS